MHYQNQLKSTVLSLFLLFISTSSWASDTLGIMFYNVYRFPSANPQSREHILGEILSYNLPDMLLVCELENEYGADRILNNSFVQHPDSFSRANFVYNQSDPSDLLQQMLFYNTRKFTLINQEVYATEVRDINRYTLLLNTTDVATDSLIFEVFVTHLKSSTGTANVNTRFGMVDTMVKVIQTLPKDRIILFGGDMNFYRSSEIGYKHIIDTVGRVNVLVDPLGDVSGSWQDNANFTPYHTQSTRISNTGFGLYGATGGMDDRFDFIFMSDNLLTDTTGRISFLPDSYEAIGNNGNCLNKAVNDTSCVGIYDQRLRQQLHDMSDHLPVALKLTTNKTIKPIEQDSSTSLTPIVNNNLSIKIVGSNIVQHKLTLSYKLNTNYAETATINIVNAIGQVIWKENINQSNGILQIDVSQLPSGIYNIVTGYNTTNIKFLIP